MKTLLDKILICCMLVFCSCSSSEDIEQAKTDIEPPEIEEITPQLMSLGFEAYTNSQRLTKDVICTIIV